MIDYAPHMTAAIAVSDLQRSLAWYREVLGFEPIYTLDDWGWAELRTSLEGVNLGIGQFCAFYSGGRPNRLHSRDTAESSKTIGREITERLPRSLEFIDLADKTKQIRCEGCVLERI